MRTRPIAAAGTRAAPARRHRPPRRREQPLGRYPGSRAGRRAWRLLGGSWGAPGGLLGGSWGGSRGRSWGAFARTSRPRRLPAAQLATVACVTARLAYRCGGSAGITRHRRQRCGCAHRHRRWTGFPFNPATAWRMPAAGAPIGKPEYSDVSLPPTASAPPDTGQRQGSRRRRARRCSTGRWMGWADGCRRQAITSAPGAEAGGPPRQTATSPQGLGASMAYNP